MTAHLLELDINVYNTADCESVTLLERHESRQYILSYEYALIDAHIHSIFKRDHLLRLQVPHFRIFVFGGGSQCHRFCLAGASSLEKDA